MILTPELRVQVRVVLTTLLQSTDQAVQIKTLEILSKIMAADDDTPAQDVPEPLEGEDRVTEGLASEVDRLKRLGEVPRADVPPASPVTV